jgi:uncharacterized membrane protein
MPTLRFDRFDRLDALRGLAIVWMVAFHFSFDLNHFGFLTPRFNFHRDALWTTQRSCIVTLFLFCAGLSQAVALHSAQGWPRFWRRWVQIAGCAVLVSVGSAFMFPQSWIHFGVLHGVAVMLILTRLAAPLGRWLWPLGALALALPHLAAHAVFDQALLNWTGLVTKKPVTEDYVPVFPWLGVMLWGLAAGQWLLARRPGLLSGAVVGAAKPLALFGRWSLLIYMLHQPLLIAALMLFMRLR